MSEMAGQEARAPRRRRPRVFIGGLALAAGLLAAVVTATASSTVRARYYFWRLERAYQALPYGTTAASPQFNPVMHYQRKLAGGGEVAADLLLGSRHKHDYLWYWITTTSIGTFHPPRAEGPLLADTQSENWVDVRQAVHILYAFPQLHCQERMLELLGHPSAAVRVTAVRLVTRHRMKQAYPLVSHLLQSDPQVMVRALSAHAVTRLGGRKAVPLLIQALDDPGVTRSGSGRSVRGAARFWLQVLTGQTFVDKEEWERWWEQNAGDYTGASPTRSTFLISTAHTPETTCP